MVSKILRAALATSALALPTSLAAEAPMPTKQRAQPELHYIPPIATADPAPAQANASLAVFTPSANPIRHTIDYEIWDYALKQIVVSMGPSNRKAMRRPDAITGTRMRQGMQSRYRLEGSVVLYNFFNKDVIASFTEYREDLERVTNTLDIASLPRNEQLAFWINLHNVALLEQLAKNWPLREPREMKLGGVLLDDARFITIRGIPVSLRDIREEIVFRHWRDPKVIYGFWRGEIGGPQLQSHAFTGDNVASLLDVAAADYVNSLRGTQGRGEKLEVSSLYAEVAPFFFPDFDTDLRAHLAKYAEEPVQQLLAKTRLVDPSITETAIADLHGGSRPPNFLFVSSEAGGGDVELVGWSERLGQAAFELLASRNRKLRIMDLRGQPTGRVFISNVPLPEDHPNKGAVD